MTLVLHYHPLAAFCWKPLIALYENGIAFERVVVDLGDPASTEDFRRVWPMLRFPVLRDEERGATVAESTTVITYLQRFHPGRIRLVPDDPDLGWKVEMWDRFFDFYVAEPMQRIVGDRLRPAEARDPFGVKQARATLRQAYAMIEERYLAEGFVGSGALTLADCAASPALFYAHAVEPIGAGSPVLGYLRMLMLQPSFRRVLLEAEPYFKFFPMDTTLSVEPPPAS
ncbi:MAG: glutathione S-transferase family protein [Pararhizobium sp.]